ncbi:MAG: hypothetical protein LBF37_01865 [Rickettsiales bacterium]|jgi:hypothetical protein|nr:hypothetical protein [Rickettsiales bacterium]
MAGWLRLLINPRVARAVFNPRTFRAFGACGARVGAKARLTRIKFNSLIKRCGQILETAVSEYPSLNKKFNDTYKEFEQTQAKFKDVRSDEKKQTLSLGKLVVQLNNLYEKMNLNIADIIKYKNMVNMAQQSR